MLSANYVNVFAYGSNLHLERIRQRAPSVRTVEIGYVVGRKLEFHKRSVDGSAKADAMLTEKNADRLWGVIYRIHADDKVLLDRHESLGIGYDQKLVRVICSSNNSMESWIYEARRESIDKHLRPYCWYLDFVKFGALQHGLPYCYINRELSLQTIRDPNSNRESANRTVLNQPRIDVSFRSD